MSRKSRITISGNLFLLAAAATALFAEHAAAGNQSKGRSRPALA